MAGRSRKLRPFTPQMVEVLLKVYRSHGVLRVKSLRRLGVQTVLALERRNLVYKEYDAHGKYWIIRITGKGEKVARGLGG